MTKTLEVLFDVASPNLYLAWRALPEVLTRTNATLVATPVLLGGLFKLTGNQSPMTAFAGVKGKSAYDMLEIRRFITRHALRRFRMNSRFPVNTLTAMRAIVAAGRSGGAAKAEEEALSRAAVARLLGAEPSLREQIQTALNKVYREALEKRAKQFGAVEWVKEQGDPGGNYEVTLVVKA